MKEKEFNIFSPSEDSTVERAKKGEILRQRDDPIVLDTREKAEKIRTTIR